VLLLAECDRRSREKDYPAPTLDEAIKTLRTLEAEAGEAGADGSVP